MIDHELVRRQARRYWDSVSPTGVLGQAGRGGEGESFLRFACESGVRRQFAAGSEILTRFSSPRVLLVLQGQVKVIDGDSVIGIRGLGDLLGAAEVIADVHDLTQAKAVSEVVAAVVPAQRFRSYLDENPRVADMIMVWFAKQLLSLQRHRLGYKGTARQRLAQCLLDLCLATAPHRDTGEFTLPVTQRELAASVGISLASAENELRYLKREKIVCGKQRRSSTLVLSPAKLRELLIDSNVSDTYNW
ncbi:Crp/Fnr family transcriptional regulator [Micromonospora chalcea]